MELFLSASLFEDTNDKQFILLSVDWQSLITRPITSSILPSIIILYISPYLFCRFTYIAVGNIDDQSGICVEFLRTDCFLKCIYMEYFF